MPHEENDENESMETEFGEGSTETESPSDATSGALSMDEDESEEPLRDNLVCSGDAPGSPQQFNFEGAWTLKSDNAGSASNGGRPVYSHTAPDGTPVHLFFVEATSAGPAPRWVIGPDPNNGDSGWAFADSTAGRPEDIIEPWKSWVKEAEQWIEARLAFSAKTSNVVREGLGLYEDVDSGVETDGDDLKGSPQAKAKKSGATKKPAKKAGSKKGSSGGAAKGKTGGVAKPAKASAKAKAK